MRQLFLIAIIILIVPSAESITLKGLVMAPFVRSPRTNCIIALGHLRNFKQRHWTSHEKTLYAVQKMKETKKRSIKDDPSSAAFLKENKVYISLTTSPTRISQVIHTLNTIDLENVEKIFLSIPHRFSRTQAPYEIPPELLNFPKLEILRVDEDLGPATKLIPAYKKLQSENARGILITVDDDVAYAQSLVNEMIYASAQNPNAVYSGSAVPYSNYGVSYKDNRRKKKLILADGTQIKENDIVKGVSAIAYPLGIPQSFTKIVQTFANLGPSTFHSDDLTISAALGFLGVPRFQIENKYYSEHHNIPLPHSSGDDALKNIAPVGVGQKKGHDTNYQQAMSLILEAWNKQVIEEEQTP